MKTNLVKGRITTYSPVRSEAVDATEFKEIVQSTQILMVKRTRFVPPKLGKPGFGKFLVEYRVPILRNANKDISFV